ncbi:uncharacterized protein METZ01_LOCUS285324, partial [marine metagenome]
MEVACGSSDGRMHVLWSMTMNAEGAAAHDTSPSSG